MPLPVLTTEQTRAWEAASWQAGLTEREVIQAVGKAVADRALTLTRPGALIAIMAGKGHNGDDARAAIPHLKERAVRLISVTDPLKAQATLREVQAEASLFIDGLFGIGLTRPLGAEWIELIDTINAGGVPILAVDVPSGLNADSGKPEPSAIRAAATLSVGSPKVGLLQSTAWEYTGTLSVAHRVGLLLPCPIQAETAWTLSEDFQGFPPLRKVAQHKGSFGHACLIAGSTGYHGAAVLATRGALQAGAGLVSVFTTAETYIPVASQLQAAMVHPSFEMEALPENCTCVLIGPGLAHRGLPGSFVEACRKLWVESKVPVIVDASALEWLPPGGEPPGIRVITPHPGEAGRLLQRDSAQVQKDRPGAARALSERFGNCYVVLKGYQTLVTGPGAGVWVNSTGNPMMAQGGTGDVLAGYLTGLLAQPELAERPMDTLRYGVWQHGLAGDYLSNRTRHWSVEQLPEALGSADPDTVYPTVQAFR